MLTEEDKKSLRDLYARMKQGDTIALVAAIFMPEEEKGYMMYLCEEDARKEKFR